MGLNVITQSERPGGPEPSIFDSVDFEADPTALALLEDGIRGADLAAPPVILPDFHHKSNMEMPSSIAVATRGTIRPTLTSASVNCGMALIGFEADRPGRRAIEQFYRAVRNRYPYPPTYRRDLSSEEVRSCAAEGGRFAVDRFGVDPSDLDRVEEGGQLDVAKFGGLGRVRRELPWSVVQASRIRFGTVGPSNHFIELQEVEEVLDPVAAAALGLHLGQLTLQFHAGGGSLPGELGVLFGRRRRYSKPLKMQMAIQKPLYHLARARSLDDFRLRLKLFFSADAPPIPRFSAEGDRLMLATAMAMNYGFAFRLSTYASLRQLAEQTFGARASRLIVDSPHNSIYEEEVDGEPAVVHRHNSCRAHPASKMSEHPLFSRTGQPVLLPGTNRTSSYLCVAADGASSSLYSACHGSGTMIEDFARRGLSGLDPRRRTTLRFHYNAGGPEEVPHLDDRGIQEALGILTSHRLVRPVVRLRPFAVLN